MIKPFSAIAKAVALAKANPHITLTVGAVLGVVAVGCSGYSSGRKASENLAKAEASKGSPLTKKEKAVVIAKCAWVTAVLTVFTCGAMIGSTCIAQKNINKLTLAYSSAVTMLEAHQQAEVAKVGIQEAKDIKEKITDKYGLPPQTDENTINSKTSPNDELWWDSFTAFYVWTNVDQLEHLKSHLYYYMKDGDGQAELEVLFDFLGYDSRRYPKYSTDYIFCIEDTLNGCEYADHVNIKYGLANDIHGNAIHTFDYYDVAKYIGNNTYIPF